MSDSAQPWVCLDIVVDHRLRPLLKQPLPLRVSEQSKHPYFIRRIANNFQRYDGSIPREEIVVATDLAGPRTTGGVCFLLQQPAQTHPYHLGSQAVKKDSPTLNTLVEVWDAVVREAPEPSIFDRLPYVRPQDTIPLTIKADFETRSMEILQAKHPDIIICMWQGKRLKNTNRKEDTGIFRPLESLGIGRTFNFPGHDLGPHMRTRRVNAFHPSYAMNYNPHVSCFRQLLILEVAHGVGLLRNNWRNEPWMDTLRTFCSEQARRLALQSASQNSNGVNAQDIVKHYTSSLCKFSSFLNFLATDSMPTTLYDALTSRDITNSLNDVYLCATQLLLMKQTIYPEDLGEDFDSAEQELTRNSWHFLSACKHYSKQAIQRGHRCEELDQFEMIVVELTNELSQCFTNIKRTKHAVTADVALPGLPQAFQHCALSIENLLASLKKYSVKETMHDSITEALHSLNINNN